MAYIEISGETLSLVSPPRVVLSPCYYAFCEWLDGLCLCEGCGDGFVDDEGRDEIAEDRVALALGASDQTTEVLAERHIGAPALSRDAISPAPRPPLSMWSPSSKNEHCVRKFAGFYEPRETGEPFRQTPAS